METKEYRTMDKSTWGDGPWQDEPDKAQWVDEATGLPCLAVRSEMSGSLCGYVGVSDGHPLFNAGYNDCSRTPPCEPEKGSLHAWCDHSPRSLLSVHGGITFTGPCHDTGGDESIGVCHQPGEGEGGNVFWLGFDTAHASDWSPGMKARMDKVYRDKGEETPPCFNRGDLEEYRDLAYIKAECASLAKQLKDMTA